MRPTAASSAVAGSTARFIAPEGRRFCGSAGSSALGHCGTGSPTTAGNLDARWVIHTVGPVYRASEDRSATLASCYRESLRVADELGARSVAFPAVSAGVYGWPMDDAARVAIRAVRSAAPTSVELVTFVLFSEDAMAAFRKALAA